MTNSTKRHPKEDQGKRIEVGNETSFKHFRENVLGDVFKLEVLSRTEQATAALTLQPIWNFWIKGETDESSCHIHFAVCLWIVDVDNRVKKMHAFEMRCYGSIQGPWNTWGTKHPTERLTSSWPQSRSGSKRLMVLVPSQGLLALNGHSESWQKKRCEDNRVGLCQHNCGSWNKNQMESGSCKTLWYPNPFARL